MKLMFRIANQFGRNGHLSTAALIRNVKNRLKVHLFTLFSLELFDMRAEKAAVFFDKIFNLMFLLCFSVIRWNFGIFLVLFNGGVLLLIEWTYTDPVY